MEQLATKQPTRVVIVVRRGVRSTVQYLEPQWQPMAEASDQPALEPAP